MIVPVFGVVQPGPLVIEQVTPYEWRAYDARGSGAGYQVCGAQCFTVPPGDGMGEWLTFSLPTAETVQIVEGP